MSQLTIDHETPAKRQPVLTGITKVTRSRPFSVVACWEWLVAISQVAVDHRYAAPWEYDADRHRTAETETRG
ncbi:MAG: hypothetical protein ACKOPG_02160 [Novosphingobium sp.]